MTTVSPIYPKNTDDKGQLEQAFQQLAQAVNENASAPLVIQHIPSQTLSDQVSTTTDSTYKTSTINSRGGLVTIGANISASGSGYVGLSLDGGTILKVPAVSGALHWQGVLGKGNHTISIVYGASSGTVTINPTGFSSAFGIIESTSNIKQVKNV